MLKTIDTAITFKALENLSSRKTFNAIPWAFESNSKYSDFAQKADKTAWNTSPTTKHCFFSAYVGINPDERISTSNPPAFSLGIIGDYDHPVTDEQFQEAIIAFRNSENAPNYISRTFSKGVRAVWLFPHPVPYDRVVNAELMKQIAVKLRMRDLFKGLDKNYSEASQYFELGEGWRKVNDTYAISESALDTILHSVVSKAKWESTGAPEISTDLAWEEMKKRGWDKLWGDTTFTKGARGKRFFTAVPGDNPTAVLVCTRGVQCFSGGGKIFWSWDDLFGAGWSQSTTENAAAPLLEKLVYDSVDGQFYYYDAERYRWISYSFDKVVKLLKYTFKVTGQDSNGNDLASVLATNVMQDQSKITEGGAFGIYNSAMLLHTDGCSSPKRNLSSTPMFLTKPHPLKITEWGDKFPKISQFLETLLVDPSNEDETIIQLETVLAWLKAYYKQALNGSTRVGQALIMAGPPSCGKTFFGRVFLKILFGGVCGVERMFLGHDMFNAAASGSPIWYLGDIKEDGDYRDRATLQSNIKKFVADSTHNVRGMHREGFEQKIANRIVFTLNDTPQSLDMLPAFDESSLDKVLMIKAFKSQFPFSPDYDKSEAELREEMPYFCSFLQAYTPDERVVPSEATTYVDEVFRFGLKAYHHPDLIRASAMRSRSFDMMATLDAWRENYFKDIQEEYLDKRTAEWVAIMTNDPLYGRQASTSFAKSSVTLGRLLTAASSDPVYSTWISKVIRRGNPFFRIYKPKPGEVDIVCE